MICWPSPLPDLQHLLSPRPHDWKSRGKEKASLTLPLRFPSLAFLAALSHAISPTGQSPGSVDCRNSAPTHSQITPWWQTAGAGQLTPPSQPPVQEVGPGGRLAPLSLLPPSLLTSLWAQLTSDSGPLKSLLQPTGLGLKPAPLAPGSPAESSPLLPED